jgi:hypothetical protein
MRHLMTAGHGFSLLLVDADPRAAVAHEFQASFCTPRFLARANRRAAWDNSAQPVQ